MSQTKGNLHALVVDDERPALEELVYLLEQSGYCSAIEASSDLLDALKILRQGRSDVVFVDIQMPGMNGLEFVEVLRRFANPPRVVFVTAHEEYAVQAFGLDALDYLLKPVSAARLEQALARIAKRPDETTTESEPPARTAAIGQLDEKYRLDKLPVDREGKTILIDLADIRYAVAQGDYVYIKTFDQQYLTRFSISDLEKRLPSPPFLRTHRAFLVNLRNVSEIYPFFNGAYVLKVNDKDKSEVQVSRGHAKDLRALLGM